VVVVHDFYFETISQIVDKVLILDSIGIFLLSPMGYGQWRSSLLPYLQGTLQEDQQLDDDCGAKNPQNDWHVLLECGQP
jgi:hypothetical protein